MTATVLSGIRYADITAWDPAGPGEIVLRVATEGFVTPATATPADTHYGARILQPLNVRRDLFQSGTTLGRSRVGYGELTLANGDGALDAWLNYFVDGRTLTVGRYDTVTAVFTPEFVGTMEQMLVTADRVSIQVRDRQFEVGTPLQVTKYAGDNALPDGLEGVEDLQGKPKPVLYGTVANIAPPCVNTAKLIYQVNDGAVASVSAVYDRGVELGRDAWATATVISGGGGAAITGGLYHVDVGYVLVCDGGSVDCFTSPDFSTWTPHSITGVGDAYTGVAYSPTLTRLVACGSSGLLFYSDNGGSTWTACTIGVSVNWGDVIWVPELELYVLCGWSGKIFVSADGITWTDKTIASAVRLVGVTYALGQLVLVGVSGRLVTSPDGVTFTERTAICTGTLRKVAYGAGLYVVSGDSGAIYTSVDGLSWVPRFSGVAAGYGRVAFGGTHFTAISSANDTAIMSTNGLDWTTQDMGFGADVVYSLFWDGADMIAGGSGTKINRPALGTYATEADLLDDSLAPMAGTCRYYAAGGLLRLGAPPAGVITADVVEGATSGARTAAQIATRVLLRAGYSSGDWSAADATALDTANNSEIGFWAADEITSASVLDAVMNSIGAWWGTDNAGIFRFQQFTAPSGSPVVSLTARDLLAPPELLLPNDPGRGLPSYRSLVRYARNYTVQTDVAGGVSDARRAVLAKAWSVALSEDLTVLTACPLAIELTEDSLLTTLADAQDEADRRQTMRGVRHRRVALVVSMTDANAAVELGSVISLTHSRFNFGGGVLLRIIGVDPDAQNRKLSWECWL